MAATAMTAIATQLGMLRPASARVGRTLRRDSQGEMPALAGATQWLNSPPLTVDGLPRESRARSVLDVHLHQLAALASRCPRVGREIHGSGHRGDRRARA